MAKRAIYRRVANCQGSTTVEAAKPESVAKNLRPPAAARSLPAYDNFHAAQLPYNPSKHPFSLQNHSRVQDFRIGYFPLIGVGTLSPGLPPVFGDDFPPTSVYATSSYATSSYATSSYATSTPFDEDGTLGVSGYE